MNNGYNFFPVGYQQYPYPQFNPPQYAQPQPQQPQYSQSSGLSNPMPQYHPITWVDSEEDVKAIKMTPGTSGEFWDKGKNVIYIKSCDTTGRETIDYYDVMERPKEQPIDLSTFVSRNDFSALAQEVANIKQTLEGSIRNEHSLRENAPGSTFRLEDRTI